MTSLTQDRINQIHELVTFEEDSEGVLSIKTVKGDVETVLGSVKGDIEGNVCGDVKGNVKGDVWGNVLGSVWGSV